MEEEKKRVPRAYTEEEVRAMFLEHIWDLVRYWERTAPPQSTADRLAGLAFSILSMLDGSSTELPAFRVVCNPHPSDEAFCKEQGENWFPAGVDIGSFSLHENFHRYKPEIKKDGD